MDRELASVDESVSRGEAYAVEGRLAFAVVVALEDDARRRQGAHGGEKFRAELEQVVGRVVDEIHVPHIPGVNPGLAGLERASDLPDR